MSDQLFDAYFTAEAMKQVFCDHGRVQAMLDVEAALARAQARVGVIPHSALAPITAACRCSWPPSRGARRATRSPPPA